jgi:hypothetical protein
MTKLYLHKKEVKSVFDLLGTKENDITFSLSWCLKNVQPFLKKFIKEVTTKKYDVENVDILLQEYGDDKGYTDIELLSDEFFCIIEAKKGWNLPVKEQLLRYIDRFNKYPKLNHKLLVVSECKKAYAKKILDEYKIKLPVEFISWQQVHKWVKEVKPKCNNKQKGLLSELNSYFERVITMQDKDTNEVFCVVVSDKVLQNDFSFLDVVKKGYYFYPIAGMWPKIPPTYIAFRYRGKLMSIHYVEGYDQIDKPDDYIPELKGWKGFGKTPHYLLKLGKPFKPENEVKNGKLYATQHIKFMLDTIFTSKTIQEARDISKARKND